MCWLKETAGADGAGLPAIAGAAINSHAITKRPPGDLTILFSGMGLLSGNPATRTD